MKIAISASAERFAEIQAALPAQEFELLNLEKDQEGLLNADALFILDKQYSQIPEAIAIPVFIHELCNVNDTIFKRENVYRINFWPGFETNDGWEVNKPPGESARSVFDSLEKKWISSPDIPGLISARVIAMIINEAYFAMEDGVSSAKEIDTAMKLGTNYPYGPIEWAEKIGKTEILNLLQSMEKNDLKHQPATLLIQQANQA